MHGHYLQKLAQAHTQGRVLGITSVCSAHALVIEAALRNGKDGTAPVLIEATCNQVNHEGGYTGMTPTDFQRFVLEIAGRVGFDPERLILGGDHLGPNPWKHLPPQQAMLNAERMLEAYARAGFRKIHLDTSMACLGENDPLDGALVAGRAARLAAVVERTVNEAGLPPPFYVIGTEVPVPGGASEKVEDLQVTTAQSALETIELHRQAFLSKGLNSVFARVIGLVVQPGVEFGNENVVVYQPEKAQQLSALLQGEPQLVFEAHSTDYQPTAALQHLVRDGFAILKVGPGLTFALREALYALDHIAAAMRPLPEHESLRSTMESLMLAEPHYWDHYYHGDDAARRVQRHFSYSDRIRYYWPFAAASRAVEAMFSAFGDEPIPETLVSQYLPQLYPYVASGQADSSARSLVLAAIGQVLAQYQAACGE
ncbi:D-tagatose-bisphosphate aldolase, class II, non-catalytic subunit [Pseudomonas sp. SZMC_28357]|uniref:D-tagatose-bisphosphate aldolase, class II, non-catalytic subunit n=1 Tax=Pseudomonas sp. SZMC_28357 TaxID=3074380 RepID=UPI002871D811|nr:D-tagatose-bisphosphate aldolase, class II, non-catalytic subunit [Pseudomonas sp. SZMC_28357]MDR9751682.1 D-tagatose-bisphosphate aldolase, class II, non-catalytic subunit [Pseudomonas sp. SZMC_28357]